MSAVKAPERCVKDHNHFVKQKKETYYALWKKA